ncbi:Nif3-like dinuclear metal center hexameric protein [Sansalvadorimonas sp. 2012CJ34-2]|uniref:Nif3-like dinuclear metal center hexameric protein n=1 Tax=Parendozoicomonas callyspongiae TaxID=2942213 RepID=A0ABT0PCC9_9GAMM|nr:Nif3-like dinuclear metal center hexameric protein [Sansalvadorimonas sp. 2012CJ34-2]MCL6268876.1 Nif3-like dinuclear metal center hexameric protein [Sansalvadorimonas sp. 2012CJ34-2]
MKLKELIEILGNELQPEQFRDYCPNGLQVEGKPDVLKIATGVTACEALIDKAISWGADALLVHHGYFWKSENAQIVGMKKRRLQKLLANDLSLLVYHLPLDAHPTMGNNATLASMLNICETGPLDPLESRPIGNIGELDTPETLEDFGKRVGGVLGREPLLISGGDHPIKTIGWCTGGAQGYIDKALAAGVDAFISGEISESTVHTAREEGIHYIAAGHHATERGGVMAFGEWLEKEHGLEHQFFDIGNPV